MEQSLLVLAFCTFATLVVARELKRTEPHGKRMVLRAGDQTTEMFTVDVENSREVVEVRNETSGQTSIAVLDFQRSLASAYIEAADECFLLGGLDNRLPRPDATLADWDDLEMDGPRGPEDEGSAWEELVYVPADDMLAADASMVAEEIRDVCQGKSLVWLERKQSERTRHRRQLMGGADWQTGSVSQTFGGSNGGAMSFPQWGQPSPVQLRVNGRGSIGSLGTMLDGDLHVDYTRRSDSTSHTVGGSVGGTYVKPLGYPSTFNPRWKARYGITHHGRRTNYGVDFHLAGGQSGLTGAGIGLRIEY